MEQPKPMWWHLPLGQSCSCAKKRGQPHSRWRRCTKAAPRIPVCVSARCSARCPMPRGHSRDRLVCGHASQQTHAAIGHAQGGGSASNLRSEGCSLGLCSVARDPQHSLCCRPERVRMTSASPVRSLTCAPWSPGTCQELVRDRLACGMHFARLCLRQGTLTETYCMHTADGPAAGGGLLRRASLHPAGCVDRAGPQLSTE